MRTQGGYCYVLFALLHMQKPSITNLNMIVSNIAYIIAESISHTLNEKKHIHTSDRWKEINK